MMELRLRQVNRLNAVDKHLMREVCENSLAGGCLICNVVSTDPRFFETHRDSTSHWKVVRCRCAHAARVRSGVDDPCYCPRCGCDNQSAEGLEAHLAGKAHRKALHAAAQLRAYELLLAALGDDEADRVEVMVVGEPLDGQGDAVAQRDVDDDGEGKVLDDVESVEGDLRRIEMAAQARVREANNRLLLDREGQEAIAMSSLVEPAEHLGVVNADAGSARGPQGRESKVDPSGSRELRGGDAHGVGSREELALAADVAMRTSAVDVEMSAVDGKMRRLDILQRMLQAGLAEVRASVADSSGDLGCGAATL